MKRLVGALGVQVDLYPGEWLQSAISRWAWDTFGVSRGALLDVIGLAGRSPSLTALGTRLRPEQATLLAEATGLTEARLHEATMASLDGRLVWLARRADGGFLATNVKDGMWTWQVGTRYCPDCLRDVPGVFHKNWRSPWVYACLDHHRVLLDACSACYGEIAEMRSTNRDVFDPSTCRASLAPPTANRRVPCRAPLADTWDDTFLDTGGASMLAQRRILAPRNPIDQKKLLWLLQSAATALRAAKAFDEIARLSGLNADSLVGLFDEEARAGTSPPKSAYAMAALLGAASTLVQLDEPSARSVIRDVTFARPPARAPRDVGFGPGSPRELVDRWPHAPSEFLAQVRRALDPDLTVTQRILWDTAATPATVHAHRHTAFNADKRLAGTPELLWPAWCSRLDVGGMVKGTTLARALAFAVRVAGTAEHSQDDRALARVLRPNMLGKHHQTDQLLAAISELAHTIDSTAHVIDYRRRHSLSINELLPVDHWRFLADSIGIKPGRDLRHRNARRYIWQRLTRRELPVGHRVETRRYDANDFTEFATQMTVELQAALDQYGEAFLRSRGIHEPATWTPEPVVKLQWPGREILDIDIERLHTLLGDGTYGHHELAKELKVSVRQVLLAIDEAPPRVNTPTGAVPWEQLLPPRPPAVES